MLAEAGAAADEEADARAAAEAARRATEAGARAAEMVAGARRAKKARVTSERAQRWQREEAPDRVARGRPWTGRQTHAAPSGVAVLRPRAPLKRGRDVFARDETIRYEE